ncbi:SMC-Scp complex subunit ScpB [Roseivirga sp.]|nr:SMC-Scp complex subunit ScpB [Roseivirga sp.]
MDFLVQHIEALIFCAQKPIRLIELKACLTEMFEADVPEKDIEKAIEQLVEKYSNDNFSFEVVKSGGGYQFLTKPSYQTSIGILLKQQSKKRLSTSALETLSIIAYKQPTTKSELEQIRGVNCDYSVQRLLEKELIEIKGKSENVGRPILYGTSDQFMDYFGINDLKDLPTPKDFATPDNEIGSPEKEGENPSDE